MCFPQQSLEESDRKFMDCESTAKIKSLEEIIGQDRAIRALKFGLNIKNRGFNVYVAESPGTERTTAVKEFLDDVAKNETRTLGVVLCSAR